MGAALTGDPRVYGRVYLGTNGRGILYADRQGGNSTDTTAPTTPGTPTASTSTSSGASLTWTASTDNVGVTGYDVINGSNTVVATSTTNSVTLTGLTPSTQYVLRVRARDAAGNVSSAVRRVPPCRVAGRVASPVGSGRVASGRSPVALLWWSGRSDAGSGSTLG